MDLIFSGYEDSKEN